MVEKRVNKVKGLKNNVFEKVAVESGSFVSGEA